MNIYVTKNYEEMSRKAANIISAQMILKPDSILGLATGSSPIGIYDQLVEWYKKGDLDFADIRTVNLDEYKGLGREHPQSYAAFMWEHLFSRVNIKAENTFLPDGTIEDEAEACGSYNKCLERLGKQDIQLLGIGRNGHIGFNEPSSVFELDVHTVGLSESTVDANKRFFESKEAVPEKAYTMGIRSILRAKKILLIASGEDKADAIAKTLRGPVTPFVPASILLLHPDVTIVCDRAAYSKMEN